MDYTEQFIRLNCSLMSDYKMMKLNADMKCMGLGCILKRYCFCANSRNTNMILMN